MPAPQASQLESVADGMVRAAALQGEDAPGLAKALAQSTAQALALFAAQGMVLPGIPAAAVPPPGNGATAGPGRLMPPPAGGPIAPQLEGICNAQLTAQGIKGEDAPGLAKTMAATIAQGIQLFASQTMVMPGIAIAGFVTTAPGMLQPVPLASSVEGAAKGFMQRDGLRGEHAPDFAQAMANTVDLALTQFAAQVMVAPGIPCSPGASAGPGRLM
ncbi:MAG TPA: hypothetical protein VLC08_14480 [Chitinolyticbacter sp.]|nr:hypothetical protein [Chitinolyticbacter sp.]